MSVAETRARIVIDSKNAQHSLESLAKSMERFDKAMGGTKFNNFSSGINKVNVELNTLTKSIVSAEAGLKALEKFGGMISTVLGGAYNYATVLESNAVGISGILTSMTKLDGKTLEWNKSLAISKDIMKELRATSLQTASTAPELIDTFRALLGPAMGTGMNVKEVMQLTTVGVNAVKSMGLGGVQLVQELRSIVQGSIKPASSTLATALGITNADVKNAIASSDGLFKFLMQRLKGFEMSVGETSKTIKGRIDILTEALYQSIEKGSGQVFETIRDTLKNLSDQILLKNETTGLFELNPEFVKQIENVSNFVNDILKGITKIGTSLFSNIDGITNATLSFLKWELLIGVGGTVVSGIGKFKDLCLQAKDTVSSMVGFFTGINSSVEKNVAIENEITNSLKEQKTIKQEIDNYNKNVLKSIKNEVNEQRKITQEIEKQKNLASKNASAILQFQKKGDYVAPNDINTIKNLGRRMNLKQVDIEEWVSKYIKDYQEYGEKHAKAYVNAFKNGLQKSNIGNDIKALMQKSNSELSYNDFTKLASTRNNLLTNAGASKEQLTNIQNLDKAFNSLALTMEKAGVSQNAISQEMVRFTKEIINANGDLTKVKVVLNEQQIKEYEQNIKSQLAYEKTMSAIGSVSGALTGLGFAYQMVTNDNESCLGKMAEWAIMSGTVIGAIGQIGVAYKELATIVKDLTIKESLLKLVQMGLAHPALLAGIAGITIAGAIIYSVNDDLQNYKNGKLPTIDDDNKLDYINNDETENTVEAWKERFKQKKHDTGYDANNDHYVENETIKTPYSGLTNAFPTGGGGDSGNSKAQREAEKLKKLQQKADEAKRSYDNLIASIKVANDGLDTNATEFTKKQDEIDKKVLGWQNNFKKLQDSRQFTEAEINDLNALIGKYRELAEAENERNKQKSWYSNELTHIENLKALGEITTQEANQRRAETLQNEVTFMQSQYSLYEEHSTKRIELEQQVANKIKEIRDLELTDGKIHWDNLMEHIRNTTFNQTEVVKNTFDSMINTFTNFGQNFLTEGKSIGESAKEMFKSFANSIWNMMMKLIMQGLVMKAILGLTGGGGNAPTIGNGSNMSLGLGAWGNGVPEFAKGGVAEGWSIVGEKGPELVNFSSPARVYTADQTRNALSGAGNGNLNIKFDIKNETGTQMQAEQTGSKFDGESYVVGIVLKAISTNKNGMRNIIKGVATS